MSQIDLQTLRDLLDREREELKTSLKDYVDYTIDTRFDRLKNLWVEFARSSDGYDILQRALAQQQQQSDQPATVEDQSSMTTINNATATFSGAPKVSRAGAEPPKKLRRRSSKVAAAEVESKRGRGRPPGYKKQKAVAETVASSAGPSQPKRRPGRPFKENPNLAKQSAFVVVRPQRQPKTSPFGGGGGGMKKKVNASGIKGNSNREPSGNDEFVAAAVGVDYSAVKKSPGRPKKVHFDC